MVRCEEIYCMRALREVRRILRGRTGAGTRDGEQAQELRRQKEDIRCRSCDYHLVIAHFTLKVDLVLKDNFQTKSCYAHPACNMSQ